MDKKNKKKGWIPDPRYTDILKRYFELGLSAWSAHKQVVPPNRWEITKMPDYKTVNKYWNFWKKQHSEDHMLDLAQNQRQVKGQFEIMYDKRIMICEDQLQKLLKFREEDDIKYVQDEKVKIDSDPKKKTIDPRRPDLGVELALAKINELQGDFQMAKSAMMAAPTVSQISEDSIILKLEEAQEMVALRMAKARNGSKRSK